MKNVIYVLCILGFIFFKVGCEKHHTPCAECKNRINVLILPQEAKVEDFLNLIRKQVENGIGSFFIKNEKTGTSLHYFSCDTWQSGWRGKMAGDFNEYSFYGKAPEDVDLFKITFYSSNRIVAGGKNCSPMQLPSILGKLKKDTGIIIMFKDNIIMDDVWETLVHIYEIANKRVIFELPDDNYPYEFK